MIIVGRQNVNSHLESHTQMDELGSKLRLCNWFSNIFFWSNNLIIRNPSLRILGAFKKCVECIHSPHSNKPTLVFSL